MSLLVYAKTEAEYEKHLRPDANESTRSMRRRPPIGGVLPPELGQLPYDKKMPKKIDVGTYQSNLQKIANFNTVEDFWRHYIHVKRPSQLSRDVNLYLFRDQPNCAPMWEAFPQGGCWILKIKKKANVLGKMWQDLVFAAIGEAFEQLDVVGIAMAIRSKEDMLSVWNADNSDDNTRFAIGEKLKEILMLDSNTLVEYKFHANSIRDMSTFRNAKPYVFAAATPATTN
ncbi:eukaryotic initiation factor 4E, putative [Phytophthora infestans T30-4]|uniref:Eukaryotic initiation factor 4E, putative n=1 Tax=Phytophthora infestans (strain T30-4) TaxID=403677 RepID=D0P4V5_PHYIT|nr:eukaryotic initiation factor 4E, putative [Phytophthora infestans T30-4]EEY52911.1 eukaryotic initiation factor 4E, putative [Phytophthora infestans T30-4]|eukprot:XP_002894743.1 eukaryotic initiation factor 4E, putative [Phytophthora infestans T30-4]